MRIFPADHGEAQDWAPENGILWGQEMGVIYVKLVKHTD